MDQSEFIARHSESDFRHKDELFSLLAAGNAVFETNFSVVPRANLLNIYRRRAEHLQHYSTAHAQQLRDDVVALCNALATTSDESCRLWIFSVPPNSGYTVFEGMDTGRILGCVFGKDKRLTPPDEWDDLWRENNTL